MNKNYTQLLKSLNNRYNPDEIEVIKSFQEKLAAISYTDAQKYVRDSMNGVPPEYTKKSREAGTRVKEHLEKVLTDVSYEYQGSVMTETHIRGYSDIDLLVICEKFYTVDIQKVNTLIGGGTTTMVKYGDIKYNRLKVEYNNPKYPGTALDDLRSIRIDSEKTLNDIYIDCDTRGPKAIRIKNRSLNREVDIVTANWYDDVESIINGKGSYRGVQIYNKALHEKGMPNYPFLSIERINNRSSSTSGRLKKMIRFLKNVKADSDQIIDVTSFEINAICYDIETYRYSDKSYLELVDVLQTQLTSLCTDYNHQERLRSVDGREFILKNNRSKIEELKKLLQEIVLINLDLKQQLNS